MIETINKLGEINKSLILVKSTIIIYSFDECRFYHINYLKSLFPNIEIDENPYYEDLIDLLPIKKQEYIYINIEQLKEGKLNLIDLNSDIYIGNKIKNINIRIQINSNKNLLFIYLKNNSVSINNLEEDASLQTIFNKIESINNTRYSSCNVVDKFYYERLSRVSLFTYFQNYEKWHYNFENKCLIRKYSLEKNFRLSGKNIRDVLFYNISDDDFESLSKWIDASRAAKKKSNYIFKLKADKSYFEKWKINYLFYFPKTDLEPELLTCLIKEVKNITENLYDLEETITQIKLTESVKTHFLSHLSHEIRTPLNILSGFSEILLNDKNNFLPEYNNAISFANKSLLSQINSISDYISILNNTYKLFPEEINVWKMLSELKVHFNNKYEGSAKIMFINNRDNTSIISDYKLIYSAVYKVIENAVNNTSQGYILIEYTIKNNRLDIKISDTGKGIKNKDINKIFLPFEKSDEFMPGVGLGLTTVSMIAKKLGGEINIITEENKGTTFTFSVFMNKKVNYNYSSLNSEIINDVPKFNLPIYIFSNQNINPFSSIINIYHEYRIRNFNNINDFESALRLDRPLLFIVDIINNKDLRAEILKIILKYTPNKKVIELLNNNYSDDEYDCNDWITFIEKPVSIINLKEKILDCILN